MENIVHKLQAAHPHITFELGNTLRWSPKQRKITYAPLSQPVAVWGMLHELGHALLEHTTYSTDVNLLRKEAEAWQHALKLAREYGVAISEDHIQDCLDTYRDWLHKRSTCPHCLSHGLQQARNTYHCLNCQNEWQVSSSRLCRPYRLKMAQTA